MREYLKELRLKSGMSTNEVSEKFGISRQYYNMIESGERQKKMDITLIAKISMLFGVSIEYIMDHENAIFHSVPPDTVTGCRR